MGCHVIEGGSALAKTSKAAARLEGATVETSLCEAIPPGSPRERPCHRLLPRRAANTHLIHGPCRVMG